MKTITDNRKSRGRPKTGATLVGVRIEPKMLQALDKLAAETNSTRPEALRFAFSEWAASTGHSEENHLSNEQPVLAMLKTSVVAEIDRSFGRDRREEIVSLIVENWMKTQTDIKA